MKTAPLGEVATIERRGLDPASLPSDTRYLGLEHIERGGRIVGSDTVGRAELTSTKFAFTPEHVLYGKLRPNLGKVTRPPFTGVCSTDILPIRPGPHLDRDYLAHYLSQPAMIDFAASRTSGANLPRISPTVLGAFEIPLPPLDEQRRIAAILDLASTLRQKPERVLDELDALVEAQFAEMFDGEYEQKPISELCELLVDCVNRTAPTVDEKTPYKMLRTTNVRFGRVNTADVKFVSAETFARWNRRATPQRGDVILTREAPVGEAGILDSDDKVFLGQRLFLYRADPKQMTPEFLLACFQSPLLRAQFDRLGSGSTVKHLPLPACQSFLVPSPPVEVQFQYSAYVQCVSKIAQPVRALSTRMDELFASLQSRAFSSQL